MDTGGLTSKDHFASFSLICLECCLKYSLSSLSLSLKYAFIDLRERGREGEKEIDTMREKGQPHQLPLRNNPPPFFWGMSLQLVHMP